MVHYPRLLSRWRQPSQPGPSSTNSNSSPGSATTVPAAEGQTAQQSQTTLQDVDTATASLQNALQVVLYSQAPAIRRITCHDMHRVYEELYLGATRIAVQDIDPLPEEKYQTRGMVRAYQLIMEQVNKVWDSIDDLDQCFPTDDIDSLRILEDETLREMAMHVETISDRLKGVMTLYNDYRTSLATHEGQREKKRVEKLEEKTAKHRQNMETLTSVTASAAAILSAARPV
ncbi:hypothetical protein Forpe1208_v016757 [Fusarium oxysporum f. sp. rapae]|uniref:Uncharacterized protein n=1 Tax=Fusarium oxysporum f. sp. rapae TaxID=485398 RepID=A0A8J5NFD4_FUSOX|nr:hypothetical protein Forpe1208_v016757 [Fusarium oxysporum f. sp. rapae]